MNVGLFKVYVLTALFVDGSFRQSFSTSESRRSKRHVEGQETKKSKGRCTEAAAVDVQTRQKEDRYTVDNR